MTLTQAYAQGQAADPIETTIGQRLNEIAAAQPNHPGLIMPHQNIRWSYAEFLTEVDKLATGLLKLGLTKGDRVAIWSPNRYEWVLTQFATAKIGAIMVCINPAYRLYELEYALNKVSCKAIISAESFKTSYYLEMLQTLAPELQSCAPGELSAQKLPHLKHVIRMGSATTPGMHNFNAVCQLGGANEYAQLSTIETQLDANDAINIQFTSGTTGNPKGATLTHRNILNNAYFVGRNMQLSSADKLCIPVPFTTALAWLWAPFVASAMAPLWYYPAKRLNRSRSCKRYKTNNAPRCMAYLLCSLLNWTTQTLQTTTSVRCAPESLPVRRVRELMKRLISDMDLNGIVIAYGQTECSPVDTMTEMDDPFEARVSTVGRPHTNWEIKICREDGSANIAKPERYARAGTV